MKALHNPQFRHLPLLAQLRAPARHTETKRFRRSPLWGILLGCVQDGRTEINALKVQQTGDTVGRTRRRITRWGITCLIFELFPRKVFNHVQDPQLAEATVRTLTSRQAEPALRTHAPVATSPPSA